MKRRSHAKHHNHQRRSESDESDFSDENSNPIKRKSHARKHHKSHHRSHSRHDLKTSDSDDRWGNRRSRSLGKSSDDNNEESGRRAKHKSSHHHHHSHHKQKSDEPEWANDRPQQVTDPNGKQTEDAPKEANQENGGSHNPQHG